MRSSKPAGDQDPIAALGPSPSILLLRQDRFGDVLMSSFMLTTLRERYPNSKISILLGKKNAAAAPMLPIPCDVFVYRKQPAEDWKMLRALRKQKIDIAIDMTDKASVTSSILLTMIGARVTIGVEKENSVVYDVTVPRLNTETVHVARRTAELLRPFGIDPDTVNLQPRAKIAINRVAGRVGFNVSARVPERCAPAGASAAIVAGLLKSGIREVVIYADPDDRTRGEEIVRTVNNPRVTLAPNAPGFPAFAEQIATCEYLITTDTSVVQIAAAAGIPTLVLFNPTPGLHFWTPQGVPFEEYVQHPQLAALEPQPALALFKKLTASQP